MINEIMKINKQTIAFILLMCIILINPIMLYNLNKFIIGRIIIIFGIIYFAHSNIVLGLLSAGIYIAILEKYKYAVEGMTNANNMGNNKYNANKIKGSNVAIHAQHASSSKRKSTTTVRKENMYEERINTINTTGEIISKEGDEADMDDVGKINIFTDKNVGTDREDLKINIQSVNSNSLPINKLMFASGDNVEPFYMPSKK